jgi:hypothetical protein
VNILDLMDDPRLFEKHFPGGTWDAWRAALAALFALPMDEAMATTYRTCTGRTNLPTKPFNRLRKKCRETAAIVIRFACHRSSEDCECAERINGRRGCFAM